MVVLEIAMTAPVKRLSSVVHPKSCPTTYPSHTMMLDCRTAVRPAVGPTCASLRMLNSRPSENISRMTPSSESVRTTALSATSGIGTCGPTIKPAMMYPNTTGWRSRWNTTVVTAATPRTIVRALRNAWASCMVSAGVDGIVGFGRIYRVGEKGPTADSVRSRPVRGGRPVFGPPC